MTSHPAWTRTVAALAATTLMALSACSTTPPANADLETARAAVARARATPAPGATASVELDRAQRALQQAETAWTRYRDQEETSHFAYVARRRSEIAVALAEQAQADARIQQSSTERERARLLARTQEANAAAQAAQAARQQAELARQRAQALERDLQSLRARSTQRGILVTLGDVLFATGRAELQPGARRTVQRIAQVLQQYPERRLLVEGFTDSRGSEALNQRLSERRAEAFRLALLQAGVASERVDAQGRGEADPVADNGSAAGRQKNRRVEVLFSGPEGRFGDR